MQTYWLSTHLGYACRHSGACCSSRWPIPIERDRAALVQRAIDEGCVRPAVAAWLEPAPNAPGDVAGILAHRPDGDCVFHGPSGCAIYGARPGSCEHFPHVCVIDARGIHVTLSHYCPTAAAMLFRDGVPEVVEGPPLFFDGRRPEGLDAEDALPPTRWGAADGADTDRGVDDADGADRRRARTPCLMGWDEVTRWEQRAVHEVASDARVPALPELALFEGARDAVPAGLWWPGAPPDVEQAWARWVAPAWPSWTAVVGRYLAAKVHASWAMYLGSGPADVRRGVDIARAVLQVEAVRGCVCAGRALDRPLLESAIRQSDLLLVHYADPQRLACS